jgi:hypothetical protein
MASRWFAIHSSASCCVRPRGEVVRHQLRLLRQAVDHHYDLVVVDADAIDAEMREGSRAAAVSMSIAVNRSCRSAREPVHSLSSRAIYRAVRHFDCPPLCTSPDISVRQAATRLEG